MRAIGITRFGDPGVLHFVELPDPEAGPGEVRIRVRAAAVNPTDTGLRSGGRAALLKDIPPPYVPGMDAAGILDQIGAGVPAGLQVGDHVMAIVVPHGSRGAYSDFVVVPAESVTRVPAGATDAEAATLPMNGLTTRQALDLLGLAPGQVLAVTGAADASAQDVQLVKDLGADIVLRRGADFAGQVREVLPGGADGLIDAALLNELAIPAVRDGGRIATVRGFRGEPERGITFHPVSVRTYAREREKLDRLRHQAEAGEVTLRVATALPAERAAEAHRLLEAGGTRGRLILEF